MYKMINDYYKSKFYAVQNVATFVEHNLITDNEFKDITGFNYKL